jgi:hypothetical protein
LFLVGIDDLSWVLVLGVFLGLFAYGDHMVPPNPSAAQTYPGKFEQLMGWVAPYDHHMIHTIF